MADVFISYSKKDHEEARLLAAFLEAEGYSVWWDASLVSGESFRKVIMTELGRARAVIVIWTLNSIDSDWVQSEAGRALADRKLIPVKSKVLAYKDIPPPFDNMHIETAGAHDKILGALVAQLSKPDVQPSSLQRVTKVARYELLSWFGIAGAAITLVTNLQSLLTLARWVRPLFESWTYVLKLVWTNLLFFLPAIDAMDSLLLTFLSFATINVVMSSKRFARPGPRQHGLRSLAFAVFFVFAIFWIGWSRELSALAQAPGYYFSAIETLIDYARWLVENPFPIIGRLPLYLYLFAILYVLPLLPFALLYYVLRHLGWIELDTSALAARLWRIVAGVFLLIVLNFTVLGIEYFWMPAPPRRRNSIEDLL